MTKLFYLKDSYRTEVSATVLGITEQDGILLYKSLLYPTSGAQPGKSGNLIWAEGEMMIETAQKMDHGKVVLAPTEEQLLPVVGTDLT